MIPSVLGKKLSASLFFWHSNSNFFFPFRKEWSQPATFCRHKSLQCSIIKETPAAKLLRVTRRVRGKPPGEPVGPWGSRGGRHGNDAMLKKLQKLWITKFTHCKGKITQLLISFEWIILSSCIVPLFTIDFLISQCAFLAAEVWQMLMCSLLTISSAVSL